MFASGWTAEDVMSELDDIQDDDDKLPDDVLKRRWRDHDKYVCAICERYHTLDDPEAVIVHIERQH